MTGKKSSSDSVHPTKTNRRSFNTWETFTSMARVGISLPLLFTPQLVSLGTELTRIISGKSTLQPGLNDYRFKDPAWETNPIYKASMQTYLAWCGYLQGLIDETPLSEDEKLQAKTAIERLTHSLSPSHPGASLDAVQHTIKARGASLVHGLNRMTSDVLGLEEPVISSVSSKLTIGKDIAITAGSVVFRNELLELIQYKTVSAKVYREPILLISSPINKFYIYDLYPHNSLTHYLVEAGFQVFTLSWRNPSQKHKHWNLESYIESLLDATETVHAISGNTKLHLFGYSAGGIFAALLSSILAQRDGIEATTASFVVTNFYTQTRAQVGIAISQQMLLAAKTLLKLRGILEGKELARMFAWLRPNCLLWNAWTCNYFAGEDQPTADVRYWNTDIPRIPNSLFCDFLDLYSDDYLLQPGHLTLCGYPVDLSLITGDKYFVAGSSDHITPWEYCYQSSLKLSGQREFVLVNRGHMRSLICPEGSKAARFYTNTRADENYSDWLSEATQHQGSWWSHWIDWLQQRSTNTKNNLHKLGNTEFPPLAPAPGKYVIE